MSNYTYHGTTDLVTLPQRNVQTFPSGLVRVDRVYACRKTLADRFRRDLAVGNPLPFDDGTPAIDGLYIFPEPQEIRRDDGFVEFRVSAYGRTSGAELQGDINNQGVFASLRNFDFLSREYTLSRVLPSSVSLSEIFQAPDIVPEREFVPKSTDFETTESIQVVNGPARIGKFGAFFQVFPDKYAVIATVRFSGFALPLDRVYIAPKSLQYRAHTSQSYGRFSEYFITYGQRNPELIVNFFSPVSIQ
jgi:hypothetical protein